MSTFTWPTGVRAVFFDAVGTLIHPEPPAVEVYAAVGGQFGSQLTPAAIRPRFRAAFQREEGFDAAHGLQTSEAREHERWQRIVAAVLDDVSDPAACFQELFQHFGRPQAWRSEPDAAVVLRELANRGNVLGVASNYDARLYPVLAGLPGWPVLPYVVISSEVGWRKPAAEFFAELCRRCGCLPEEVLLVGDDLRNDYEGARATGLRAVLLDPERQAVEPGVERIGRLLELI